MKTRTIGLNKQASFVNFSKVDKAKIVLRQYF